MQEEEGNVHQNGRARVGLGGLAMTTCLVIVGAAIILSKFFHSYSLARIQIPYITAF